jgi:hypothetical protein
MLIEVLATAAVAAVLLAALMRAFSSVWGGIGTVREDTEAMMVARAVIEASTPRTNLVPLTQEGTIGRYSWAISIVSTGVTMMPPSDQQQQQGQQQQGQQQQGVGTFTQGMPGMQSMLQQQQQQQQQGQEQQDPSSQNQAAQQAPWTLFRIDVAVRAPSGRRTTIETMRLSRPTQR